MYVYTIDTVVEMVIICVVNMGWTKCHPRNGPKVGKEEVLFPCPAMPSTTREGWYGIIHVLLPLPHTP